MVEFNVEPGRQSYEPEPIIEGIQILPLNLMESPEGGFMELLRVNGADQLQASYTYLEPGALKGAHLHKDQGDYTVALNKVVVGLVDCRKDSHTEGLSMRFVLNGRQLLVIPPGVAHTYYNPYPRRSHMVYFTDRHFNAQDPDEYRLPFDYVVGPDFLKFRKD